MIKPLYPNLNIYDNHYYRLNKKLLRVVGLWPYDSKKKITRTFWLILIVLLTIPHVIGLKVNDGIRVFKVIHVGYFQGEAYCCKMVCIYEDIANNWSMIGDEDERRILVEYSEKGRLLTLAYIAVVVLSVILFITLPLVPEILNATNPLPVSRPHIFIFHGEFLIDKDAHYLKIYICDVMIIMSTIAVGFAVDTMYMAGVEHCSALYSIVRYRVSKLRSDGNDNSYERLVGTVKLHQVVMRFTRNINDSYSLCFLCLAFTNMGALPISCVLMITYWGDPANFFRLGLFFSCLMLHLFVLFWPGQKLADHSATLMEDAYCNDWYETPVRTKKVLRFFLLRCTQPPLLTAGGLIVMNVANYFTVVKTAVSYVTVLLSFR